MSKNILVLRHMYSADLCSLETIFNERGFKITKVEGFSTDISQINPLAYDAVIVLGGAMGVYQADLFPYLNDEMELIRKCVAADHPMLGICLGSQLTAGALGQKVYKGTAGKEIGFMDIELTDAAHQTPLRHFDKSKTKVFQWHGDTFDLPPEATLLASSKQYKNQAFRIGKNIFATQFHPEIDSNGLFNTLVESCNETDVIGIRKQAESDLEKMVSQLRLFVGDLLTHWKIA
jgi:GMP synthase (glutamine-hydrolysing)